MCVALPARLVEISDQGHATLDRRGIAVDGSGVERDVALAMVPEARVGDYVVVHSGYAIRKVNGSEAQEALALFRSKGSDG